MNTYCTLATLLFLFSFSLGFSQQQKDVWIEVNDGFAKCAAIGQSAGYASWQQDDFQVRATAHLQGDMFFDIQYGTNGENKAICNGGFFKHDTLANVWVKVAENPPSALLTSNGSAIFSLWGGRVYQFTTDYTAHPTGWTELTTQPLLNSDAFVCSCSPGNCGNGINFQQPVDAIGDTIYAMLEVNKKGCGNYNQVAKYSIKANTWTLDRLGPYPHQMTDDDGEINDQHYKLVFADRIGGIFRYFLSYTRWGGDKCIPNFLWVWDPRSKKWENVSEGVNWMNMTGNSNPEGCVNPNGTWNSWGPSGGWTTSWDKRDIYASSETGIYRWEGDKYYYIADYWGNSSIYPTTQGIFTAPRGELFKLNPATYVPVGQLYDYNCVHNAQRFLSTPDNGKTLYVVKDGMKDPQVCTYSVSKSTQLGIYRLKFDPDNPAKARNLHVQTATYLGGAGDNTPVNTGVAGKHEVMVAGNFSEVKSPKSFTVHNYNGANNGSRGRVIHLNTFGDTIKSVSNLGNLIYDFEVQNFGQYRMVVSGDFGVSVLDSSSMNQLWNIPPSALWGTGEINVDIDDKGHVVVLRSKQFKVYDQNGVLISNGVTLTDNFVNDITINNDTVYVVGFNNGKLDGYTCVPSSPTNGLPVQSSFIKAYALSGGTLNFIFKTFGFAGDQLGKDEADTRGYRINIGKDGKVYFLGEAAGGNSVFRWNGKETVFTNGCENPKSKLVNYDQYSLPTNTKSAHIAYFCTIDPKTGEVERGQYIIPRLKSGVSNSYRIKDGYIHADQKGYVYIGGSSAYAFGGRDIQHLNGILVGSYAGGDMVVLVVNPDYSIRTFWGTFTKDSGTGVIKGFGIRDNIISTVGETSKGIMITGATKNGNFDKENAINADPFNLDMAGTNPINDTYLAVWYQDVWKHAETDTLEERKNPSNPVIDEEAANYRANFEADVTTVCVGGDVTFTNKSVGDSTNWLWNFGEGASLPVNTFGPGPFTVKYTTPGLKTVQLNVLLKSKVNDYEQKYDYINVIDPTQTLSSINGPNLICSGTKIFYSVEKVYGVSEYQWTVPGDAVLIKGQGSATIEVLWGNTPGDVSVTGVTPCGNTGVQSLTVNTLVSNEQSVLLITGDETLDASDAAIKSKIESLGYTVIVLADEKTNSAHGNCAALIVVSASVDPAMVNYKFLDTKVPVITYAASLFDEFGMTNGLEGTDLGTEAGQTQINVTDNTHQLAEGVSSGNVSVYNAGHSVNWGKPSAEGIVVATVSGASGKASIIGYEQDASMYGLKAPARRVAFYLSQSGVPSLTVDGMKLLERAICWSLYTCPASVTIETQPLASSVYCPGSEIAVPFTVTGTFNTGTITPPAQKVILDDKTKGVSILGHWSTTTAVSGYYGEAYREHDPLENKNGRFAKYNPTLLYTGTYKVSMNFPRSASFSGNVQVEIVHAEGKAVIVIDQRTGSGFIDLGTYTFQSGTSGYVTILTDGATGTVVTDVVQFESQSLTPLGGNKFIAQLSDKFGSFTAPTVIGTLEGTTSATIYGNIPDDALSGTGYKVRVVSTNPSFKGTPSTTTITIGSRPVSPAKINGNALACSGESIQVYTVDAVEGATGYTWDIPLGTHFTDFPNKTTVTTDADVTIDFGTGTTNEIRVWAVNTCGQSDEPARLLVEMTNQPPAKPAAINGNLNVCAGTQNQIYSVAPVEYASSYIWTLSSGLTGSSTTNSISVDFGSNGGTITVKAVGACGEGESISATVTINADCANAKADFSAATEVCTNTPVTFTDTSIGATSWSWDFGDGASPATISGFAPANKPPSVIYSTPGLKTVTLTINKGTAFEDSEVKTMYINVLPKASLPDILTGDGIACGTSTSTYSIPAVANANSYVWTLPEGATGTSVTTFISVNFANAKSGYITVAGVNDCGPGPESSFFVNVNNSISKPDAISGPDKVCSNAQNVTYTVEEVKGATAYLWELNGMTGTSTTNTIEVDFASAGSGQIKVKATNGCIDSDASVLDIVISPGSPTLSAAIEGPTNVCAGSTMITYAIQPVNDATAYTWSLPDGASGSSTTNVIGVNFSDELSGNISVSAVLACGASSAVSLPVTVTEGVSTPPTFSQGPESVCPNQQDVLYSVSAEGGVSEYQWTLPQGATGSSLTSTISVDFSSFTTGDISVAGVYACGVGAAAIVNINAMPVNLPLGDITGDARLCAGASDVTYTVEALESVTEYQWTLPSGASGSSNTSIINVDFNTAKSGNISVQGKTACGLTATSTLPVVIVPDTYQGVLSGDEKVCPGTQDVTYTVQQLPDALSFNWILPTGVTGTSTSNTIIVDFDESVVSSDLVAYATMACGAPVKVSLSIVVPLPLGETGPITGNDYVCKNSQSVYSIEPVANASSYQWTLPDNTSSSSTLQTTSVTLNFLKEISGALCVVAAGDCEENDPVCLPISINTEPKGVCEVFIPNAFSPNGDGSNDFWQISGLGQYEKISVKIYNRWGSLVYDKQHYDTPWDGTMDGKKLPTATYYYIIQLDNEEPRKGSVSIVRN